MTTLAEFQSTFEVEPGYFNWARFGPLSSTVRDEAVHMLDQLASGREASSRFIEAAGQDARTQVAKLLGCPDHEVTLQPSTSHGLQQTIYGITGGIVASALDFPSITVPIVRAARSAKVTPQWIDRGFRFVTPEAVADALTDETSALAVSLVDFRTGYRADLAALREVIGDDRLLIVDATQAFGVVDVDWSLADVVAGHAYKWLRAGRGTAFARFGHRARVGIDPVLSGVTGTADADAYEEVPAPDASARAFTVAPCDPLAAVRLTAAVTQVRDVGIDVIDEALVAQTQRVIDLADEHGIDVLTPRDPARRAGIVALAPAASRVGTLGAVLANDGISATVRSGLVRIAPHVGTSDESFEMLGRSFAVFAQSAPPAHSGS
ncbi:MAG: aminotransferase class V-fold PLP-dependent enzyme [Microbacterium sp.]